MDKSKTKERQEMDTTKSDKIAQDYLQKEPKLKRILISGVVIWLVGTVFGFLTCGWLFNWVYTLPPNIWKDPAVMMSAGNLIGANLTGLACAIIFTSV
ncbi:MAG: hypothetical protein WBE22_09965 [Halobacteriota archaeon]